MKISELMTREVRTCKPDETLNQAARLMWEGDCGAIPVVDAAGKVVGMVTDRDSCMAAYTKGLPLASIRVADAMAHDITSCSQRDDVERALSAMGEKRVRRLPVVDERGKLAGIVSLNDIVRATESRKPAHGVKDLAIKVAETLCAVCHPRSSHEPSKSLRPVAPAAAAAKVVQAGA